MNKNNHHKELFIAFEGIDGSGKSSQISLLNDRLIKEHHRVHKTCEPTTGRIGRMIRDIFSGEWEGDHYAIAGLFVADRLVPLSDQGGGNLRHF